MSTLEAGEGLPLNIEAGMRPLEGIKMHLKWFAKEEEWKLGRRKHYRFVWLPSFPISKRR